MAAMTLNIYTTRPRHEVLDAIKSAAASASGWIAGHAFYSNKAATIQTVVERQDLSAFLDALANDQLASRESAVFQSLLQLQKSGDVREITIACAVSFMNDEPDLKLAVPAVPG